MTQNITWGFLFSPQGQQYGGVAPYTAESAAVGSAGLGARQGARVYWRDPSNMFVGGTAGTAKDTLAFKAGADIYFSISNPTLAGFTYAAAMNPGTVKTTNDSRYHSLWTRIAGMPYNTAVAGSPYGGVTRSKIRLAIQHEVDRPDHQTWGGASAYIDYYSYLHQMAIDDGAAPHIDWSWCITAWGIPLDRVDQYYPGSSIVDSIGIDFYSDYDKNWAYDGSTTSFAVGFAPSLAYVRGKNKRFQIPELNVAESGNDSAMQAWFEGMATTLNAATDVVCDYANLWTDGTNPAFGCAKLASADPITHIAHLGKHTGILNAMNATGGNADITGPPGQVPHAPTGIAVTSSADGTSATMTWDAPLGGDSVTYARAFIGAGLTTVLHIDGGNLGTFPRSHTFHGLVPGGTRYTIAPTWGNITGNSSYGVGTDGQLVSFVTSNPPPPGGSPVITGAEMVPDPTDPQQAVFAVNAYDPNNLVPLSYRWDVTDPAGGKSSYFSASGVAGPYSREGTYSYLLTVTNTAAKFATQTGSFPIRLPNNTLTTKYFKWGKPVAGPFGTLARGLGPQLRADLDDIDLRMRIALYGQRGFDAQQGLFGSAFDFSSVSASSQAMTSNWVFWHAVVATDDHFNAIQFYLGTAQVGTGAQLAVYNALGNILDDGVYSGSAVDAAFVNGAATGIATFTPPSPVSGFGPLDVLYIAAFQTGASTPAALRVGSAPGGAAKLGSLGATQPSYGGFSIGSGGLDSTLAFTSWTATPPIWFGLG